MPHFYLLAITPPADITAELTQIQETYRTASWKKLIGPHITLVPRFNKIKSREQIYNLCKIVASRQTSFEINVRDVGFFSHATSVIFASVMISKELKGLNEALVKEFDGELAPVQDFHPHITLSNKLSPEDFERQWPDLSRLKMQYQWICDSFTLFELNPEVGWEEVRTFKFLR